MKFVSKIFCLSLLAAFAGCNNVEDSAYFKDVKPKSNGGRLDIIVVAEEAIWTDIAGETLRKYFAKAQPGLPQGEALFNVRQVTPKQFNKLLRHSRNLIFLEIDSGAADLDYKRNVYAKPQLVAKISAQSERDLAKFINQKGKKMATTFRDSEVRHWTKKIIVKSQPLPNTLKQHNVSMQIPPQFELEIEQENLLVFWNKTLKSDQGILIHFAPISDDEVILGNDIIPLRDSLTELYVPGDREGSYMVVEDYIPPTVSQTEIDGQFALETRGLWRTEGDFMGGAFISYTVYDEIHNQRITLDAFLYAPELKKRNLMLELEVVLKTLEIEN